MFFGDARTRSRSSIALPSLAGSDFTRRRCKIVDVNWVAIPQGRLPWEQIFVIFVHFPSDPVAILFVQFPFGRFVG